MTAEESLGTRRGNTPHFWRGELDVAFVLSAPGRFESDDGKPAAGATGLHLDMVLKLLHHSRPDVFPSESRYDYRIANAHTAPLAKAWGDKRTEAYVREVRDAGNVQRVRNELSGIRLAVLCGKRAWSLPPALENIVLIETSHLSQSGLNRRWKTKALGPDAAGDLPDQRKNMRLQLWAEDVINQIKLVA